MPFQKGHKINLGRVRLDMRGKRLLPIGYRHSEETRKKISQNNARWNLGRKTPEEVRKKISEKTRKAMALLPREKIGHRRGLPLSEEHKRHISESNSGEKNWNWKDGVRLRKNERNDSAYHLFVQEVRKRDKGMCRLQNENCFGYKVVHHILSWSEYPEERYNINNGITLCQYHHPRKRDDEQRLTPTLQELVGSNSNYDFSP